MNEHVAFFDLETTGLELESARVVQISTFKIPTAALMQAFFDYSIIDQKTYLINPGVPIPKEASDIHGVTDEMVRDKPPFASYAKGLYAFLEGCDLAGYNVINYDIPLLAEEFARCGIDWPTPGYNVLDPCMIFRSKEPRDLSGAVRFYCGRELEGAHGADADVMASLDVLHAQLGRYEDLTNASPADISELCGNNKRVDLAGKLELNDRGMPFYTFGKAKGKEVQADPGFGEWMLKQPFFTSNTKRVLRRILYGEV